MKRHEQASSAFSNRRYPCQHSSIPGSSNFFLTITRPAGKIITVSGRLAQRESTAFTRQGSQVQTLQRPPCISKDLADSCHVLFLLPTTQPCCISLFRAFQNTYGMVANDGGEGGARQYMHKATDASAVYSLAGFSDEEFSAMVKEHQPGRMPSGGRFPGSATELAPPSATNTKGRPVTVSLVEALLINLQ